MTAITVGPWVLQRPESSQLAVLRAPIIILGRSYLSGSEVWKNTDKGMFHSRVISQKRLAGTCMSEAVESCPSLNAIMCQAHVIFKTVL